MKPCTCIYPCSYCRKITFWHNQAMYMIYNSNSILQHYDFQCICEDCFVDYLMYVRLLNQSIDYVYINNPLKALLTQDSIYLKQYNWSIANMLNEKNIEYEQFFDYTSFFVYFLNRYTAGAEFIGLLLMYGISIYGVPLCYNNMFVDYMICNSNLYIEDKKHMMNIRNISIKKKFKLAHIEKKIPVDICKYILTF